MQQRTQFELLEDLANTRGDAVARRLRALFTRYREAESKRDALARYSEDYHQRRDAAIRSSVSGETLHNYESFLRNLETALMQQTRELEQLHADIETVQAEWRREKLRAESFATLSGRVQRERDKAEQRRQQKQQDEFAARMSQRTRANAD